MQIIKSKKTKQTKEKAKAKTKAQININTLLFFRFFAIIKNKKYFVLFT